MNLCNSIIVMEIRKRSQKLPAVTIRYGAMVDGIRGTFVYFQKEIAYYFTVIASLSMYIRFYVSTTSPISRNKDYASQLPHLSINPSHPYHTPSIHQLHDIVASQQFFQQS